MKKPAKIECVQCRKPATLTDLHCPDCGGRVVKHCGSCGWVLSVLKKYCDSCGEPQEVVSNTPMPRRLPPEPNIAPIQRIKPLPSTPKSEEPPKDDGAKHPPKDIPRTVLRRLTGEEKEAPRREKRPEPPKFDPVERLKREHEERKRAREAARAPRAAPSALRRFGDDASGERPRVERRTLVRTLVRERPVFSTLLAFMLLVGTAAVYFTVWKARRSPDRLLMKMGGAYLAALKAKDFGTAYSILSSESQKSCPPDRFEAIRETLPWNYDKLKIASMSPDRALLRYELLVSGRPAEQDWLHFVREDGKWRRAYWWHLQEPIERALEAGAPAEAARLAEEAAAINPLDPLPNAYLCESAYALENPAEAEKFCRRALDMARIYPSRLEAEDQLRLRRILADVYRRGLSDLPKAVEAYESLLGDPLLRGRDACDARLAAADLHYRMGEFSKAADHFSLADSACRDEEERAYLARRLKVLRGQAGDEAVALVQAHHMPGDKLSLLEWRIKANRDLSKRLKTRSSDYSREEAWTPLHEGGASYLVKVANAGKDVLTAEVDLWTEDIKVTIHVQ